MYTFESRIRYSETDTHERLKLESMIDYFQDCSSFQSEDLGVGFSYLREHHVAWIVNYWQIDVLRRPAFGENVRIGTSPYGFKGFIGLRNFRMETVTGEKLADANSVWSLFDLEKGLPVRVLPEMADAYQLYPRFEMEYCPRKIRIPAGEEQDCPAIVVDETMLDSNGHVNNGQYVRLAMSLLGEDAPVRRLRVEYLSQAHEHDTILPRLIRSTAEDTTTETIVLNAADGKPYAIVEASLAAQIE